MTEYQAAAKAFLTNQPMNCMVEESPIETKVLGEFNAIPKELSPNNFVCDMDDKWLWVQSDSAANAAKATAEYFDDHTGTDVAWRVTVRPRSWSGNDAEEGDVEFAVTRERPTYRTFLAR